MLTSNGVDRLDFKSGALKGIDEPTERGGSVRAGEDVLVHEKTPDEIL